MPEAPAALASHHTSDSGHASGRSAGRRAGLRSPGRVRAPGARRSAHSAFHIPSRPPFTASSQVDHPALLVTRMLLDVPAWLQPWVSIGVPQLSSLRSRHLPRGPPDGAAPLPVRLRALSYASDHTTENPEEPEIKSCALNSVSGG